jgi:hypothetical protein
MAAKMLDFLSDKNDPRKNYCSKTDIAFFGPKTHFRAERHENTEQRICYLVLEIENKKKNSKNYSPFSTGR